MNYKGLKPNVVLASFPRSGNTFLRNVLYEVYGIYSWNNIDVFNKNISKLLDLNARYEKNGKLNEPAQLKRAELISRFKDQVLKSHELPKKTLIDCTQDVKIIYLVRDGRDALVSMAHHRKDIVEPGTDFLENLELSIRASFGTYFGGWANNVEEWLKYANIVVKFEDLISDPLKYTESFRSILSLPAPKTERLPTFESQKTSGAHYGGNARSKYSEAEKSEFNNKFFRKGKVGGWKEEMPDKLHKLFWKKNGRVMEKLGYTKDGN